MIHPIRPVGHVLVPAATIAGLSMILAGGLELLGCFYPMNASISRIVNIPGTKNLPQHLPEAAIWGAAAVFALALATAILGSPGHGRRVVLWISAVAVVAAWAPVLSLASYAPEMAAPVIATLWSGVCAMVYAANHSMACDLTQPPAHDPH